nr:MAG TPA: hypothetical protein [Caudoviricetes sp.]
MLKLGIVKALGCVHTAMLCHSRGGAFYYNRREGLQKHCHK